MAGHTKWYYRTLPLCDFEIFSAISQISPFLCTSLAQGQAPGNSVRLNMPGHTWNDMPVDSHELIAKGAPRPVFISAGEKGDGLVAGQCINCQAKKDLGTSEFPKAEPALVEGEVAFRQHTQGHTPAPN